MKHLYLSVAFIICIVFSNAQGIYQLWGTTDYGGNHDQGVLFSARYDGTGIHARQAFEMYTPGALYGGPGPTAYNGKLYGMIPYAGPYGAGIIFEYDPATNSYTTRGELYTISKKPAFGAVGKFVVYNNKLYAVIQDNELPFTAFIIEFDPVGGSLQKIYEFEKATGSSPSSSLTVYNNKLYGATSYGGPLGYGVIYSFDPGTKTYSKLADLNTTTGTYVSHRLTGYNNRLYGTAANGGNDDKGTVFELNLTNNVLSKRADFAALGGVGEPGGLTVLNNKLYGGSTAGGSGDIGIIFEFDPVTYNLQMKIDLDPVNGYEMHGDLTVYDNKLYGLTKMGGSNLYGVVFEYDPATNAYVRKVNLNKDMGSEPRGGLAVYNNRLYGITYNGGTHGKGVLFEYNPGSNAYTKKIEMGNSNGFLPNGKLAYYNGRLYGTTNMGGDNKKGVIYSYDLATHTYAIRHHFTFATGHTYEQGGMVLYNNKLYGVAVNGGDNWVGVLYEFDPLTDAYTVKHMFHEPQGAHPVGVPVVYNNKLYGTTREGGNNGKGVLYEYDLATNTYAIKVHMGGSFGSAPKAGLTVYNNKLYGTAYAGGANDGGTLFEYIPAGNGFIKRHDFEKTTGYRPAAEVIFYNNILYGTTESGGVEDYGGTIFAFNPANNLFAKKYDFLSPEKEPVGSLTMLNNKLYGLTRWGSEAGTLYEYDPAWNSFSKKTEFDVINGRYPQYPGLTAVPALVAPGTPGSCQPGLSVTINISNNNQWVPVIDEEGNAIAEINANGNSLGNVTISFYTHNGATRQDASGRFYLNRNITITPSVQPATPVSIRLYIRKAEFESLKSTPNSGIVSVSDLTVFKSNSTCANAVTSTALPLTATVASWGLDYVYTAQITSFSSFYFANKGYSALPIDLEYFNGTVEAGGNRLRWKAACSASTDFVIERSADGIHFSKIGLVLATPMDCSHPLQFVDQDPLEGIQYYRLQMKESNEPDTYSSIIKLERKGAALNIQLAENPVTGNDLAFQIYSPAEASVPVTIYDMTGKATFRTQLHLQKGVQTKSVSCVQVPAGIYQAVFHAPGKVHTVRFIRR